METIFKKQPPLTQILRDMETGQTITVLAKNNMVRATISNIGMTGMFELNKFDEYTTKITRK
jgi:TusA-related sulfurtransferase